jgi:drug/metabolite transporter (DMT)-like permease
VATGVAFTGNWRQTRLAGPGVAFALVALVLFSIMTVGLDVAIERASWLGVVSVSRIVNAILTLGVLWLAVARRHARFRPVMDAPLPRNRRAFLVVVAGGCLDVAGLVALAVGLEQAPTWLVGLASSFGPAVTIVAAVVFLGERLRPIQWLGLVGIAAGLVAIALP